MTQGLHLPQFCALAEGILTRTSQRRGLRFGKVPEHSLGLGQYLGDPRGGADKQGLRQRRAGGPARPADSPASWALLAALSLSLLGAD